MIYKLNVKDRVITHPHGDNVVQNGIESDSIQVSFDGEWSNLTSCRAVFVNGDDVIGLRVKMASPITIVIPWEVLKNPGRLFVSFVGYAGEAKRIVTQIMERPFLVVSSGRIDGNDAKEPTLDELQALINAVNSSEDARAKAENSRVAAENARVSAEAARKSSETARQTAETARSADEAKRASAENARASDEAKRANTETARASAESTRASSESTRKANETARQTAERGRVAAETARETAQEKNNADQALNNAAMARNAPCICGPGEYDPSTLMPTIEGDENRVYFVPSGQGPANRYVEWMLIGGSWELMGVSDMHMEPVTTDQIDAVAAGQAPTGEETLNLTGLSYLFAKIKAAFAPKSHASTATTYGASSASSYGHAKASQTTPKAPGTAALGSEASSFARGDHVHPLPTKLATTRSIALSGDVTGSADFDGSANATIAATIKALAVKAGMIADGAVTGAKLAAASVSRAKLDSSLAQDIADLETAWDSVSQREIATGSITDDGKITYAWDKTMRQVQIRIVGYSLPAGEMYKTIALGQWFPPPYAPSSTVFVPISVDSDCLGAVYVDAAGRVFLSRRSAVPEPGATCYGAVSWFY